ncbi:phage terminase large subunit [Aurantiacibacter arachoides]|uniref:phage terminase large subunit n=1 Tax=Aurantiacibacter arachoides TaxID=1850444 RepID=UPI0013692FBD|nr:phage terminase large subunit [Aurantiacibacter arachoides]
MLIYNPIQLEAEKLALDPNLTTVLFRGGTGSGKTVFVCSQMIIRALTYANSRLICFRATSVEARDMLFNATFPETLNMMMEASQGTAWAALDQKGMITRDPMTVRFDNGSSIRFAGLDDNASIAKILGADFGTAFISECQNIDTYRVVQRVKGRLRQRLFDEAGKPMVPKLFLDCNPPSKRHWTYKVFKEDLHPITGNPLKNPETFAEIKMNAEHNLANLSDGYLDGMDYDAREHQQMVNGEWYDEVDNPLFSGEDIAACRLPQRFGADDCTDLVRVVVAVDPAVTAKEGSDETGIIVVGIDDQQHGYVLEDVSGVYTPHQWATKACEAYDRWKADKVVAEKNQGGDMVQHTLRTANPNVPVELINASRSKEIRAESTSTAYRQRRIHHCGTFPELENQLLSFETGFDRRRKGSPDRLDALVHGFNAILFTDVRNNTAKMERVKHFW